MSQPPNPPPLSPADARKARLAANLRANLKRRKAQARAIDASEESAGEPDHLADGDQPLA